MTTCKTFKKTELYLVWLRSFVSSARIRIILCTFCSRRRICKVSTFSAKRLLYFTNHKNTKIYLFFIFLSRKTTKTQQ